MNLSIKSPEELFNELKSRPIQNWESQYLAHYSSYWDGIITDPRFLLIPLDDHMVHRGDGVFEAFRSIKNNLYLLQEHLNRLKYSAQSINLQMSWTDLELKTLIHKLAEVANEPDLIFRLFVSRGSGSFGPNPYESPKSHLHVVACRFKPWPQEKYINGVTIGRSKMLQKPFPFLTIKSCNYLSNVLLKKEAVDRKLDFVVSYNENSYLTESSTENIFILNQKNELIHPPFDMILKGTTLCRCLELAHEKLHLKYRAQPITEDDLLNAKEVFVIGTTLDILPVSRYENKHYDLGPIAPILLKLMREDQLQLFKI